MLKMKVRGRDNWNHLSDLVIPTLTSIKIGGILLVLNVTHILIKGYLISEEMIPGTEIALWKN